MFSPRVCAVVHSANPSGPAIATSWPSKRRTHGTTDPYSKRISRSMRISTAPLEHSTNRTTLGLCSLSGMQSVMRTLPSGRSNSLSSTRVSPT